MEGANLPNEVTTIYEEDDQMRDQVVPQIHMRELSPSTQYNDPNQMREEEPNTLNLPLQTLYLRNSLTIAMHQNTKRNILIKVPNEILKTTMNIRFYNTSTPPKYVVLTIPTLKGKQPIEGIFLEKNQTNVNLEMSLAPGGSSTPLEELSMKILLWNYGGAHNANFMNNLRALIAWNNPTVLALTETIMEDHNKVLQALNFSDVIQVPANEYFGGIALFWRSTDVTIEPFVLTDQEIHSTIKVSSKMPKYYFSIIYAKNSSSYRNFPWNNLGHINNNIKGPLLVCGDFNEVINASEKLRERPMNNIKCAPLSKLDNMGVIDLEFIGQKFT
ncbi:hypothetical protein KY284_033198 [Solanum tuberosum]|nr:hypothetical protein KY284_033198 [Solanum tuberosum]